MDQVAHQFVNLVTQYNLQDDLQLIIDESGFAKKGTKSHGVARQYNGSRGKIDNCQFGVFAALNAGAITSIVNAKLYNSQFGYSKIDHAEELIYHVIDTLRLPVKYVTFDAFYGRDTTLLAALKRDGINFIADIPESFQVGLHPFEMRVPERKSPQGRKPSLQKPTYPFVSVRTYTTGLRKSDFTSVKIRHTSKGKLKAHFHKRQIFIIDPDTNTRMELTLLIRKDDDGTLKYSLCQAPEETSIKELGYQQCKRYFIERNFQDLKQELGMDQYQCRSEESWLKHMSLCMLAMLFIN